MELLPTDALEWAVRFEAMGHPANLRCKNASENIPSGIPRKCGKLPDLKRNPEHLVQKRLPAQHGERRDERCG
jgi:hypothetical protein